MFDARSGFDGFEQALKHIGLKGLPKITVKSNAEESLILSLQIFRRQGE
jgi:hypothetical protein